MTALRDQIIERHGAEVVAAQEALLERETATAAAKYLPMVQALKPAELMGLSRAVRATLVGLSDDGRKEAISLGYRPPGTAVGR